MTETLVVLLIQVCVYGKPTVAVLSTGNEVNHALFLKSSFILQRVSWNLYRHAEERAVTFLYGALIQTFMGRFYFILATIYELHSFSDRLFFSGKTWGKKRRKILDEKELGPFFLDFPYQFRGHWVEKELIVYFVDYWPKRKIKLLPKLVLCSVFFCFSYKGV